MTKKTNAPFGIELTRGTDLWYLIVGEQSLTWFSTHAIILKFWNVPWSWNVCFCYYQNPIASVND